jgi:hypothetical protein
MNGFNVNIFQIILIVSNIFMLVGCANNCDKAVTAQPTFYSEGAKKPAEQDGQPQYLLLEEQYGIKVESARLSAGGYMIDFRYRVLDAAKAAPILDRAAKPYLIDQATGAKFIVPNPPKVGQLRSGKSIKEGKIYFIFFANPARYVKSGNKVTVVIGDCEIKDIVVQ